MFNHYPPYTPDDAPSDFLLFLHLKKFLSGKRQRFQNDREAKKSVTVVSNLRRQTSTTQGYKIWSHGMTGVSVPEGSMLKKNSSIFAVSVSIYLSTKLGFVSVSCSRESYFVDTLRTN